MKKCDNCGNILKDDQIFCNKCGTEWVDLEAIRLAEQKVAEEKVKREEQARNRKIAEIEEKAKWQEEAQKREIAEAAEKAKWQEEEKKRKIAEAEAILAAKQAKVQEKIRLIHQKRDAKIEKKAAFNSAKHEKELKYVNMKSDGNVMTVTRTLKYKTPLKAVKLVYLILASLTVLGVAFSVPEFPTSSKDLFIFRLSYLLGIGVAVVFPGIILLFTSIRNYIPLFNKNKIVYTILGWLICFVLGTTVIVMIDSFHSDEYKSMQTKQSIRTESIEMK